MKRNLIPLLATLALTLPALAHAQGEVLENNQQAAGHGTTADNARLDPRTGQKVLPDTISSSNPGNPNGQPSPGGMGQARRERPGSTETGRVVGTVNNMNLPSQGNTPWDEIERSTAVTVQFDKGSAALSADAKAAIDGMITGAQMQGDATAMPTAAAPKPQKKIESAKVVAWGDSDQTAIKKNLSSEEQKLARERDEAVAAYLRTKLNDIGVEKYNMAKKPGMLSRIFNGSDFKIRQRFDALGEGEGSGKGSRAYVMLIMKR